jgi:dephospho-CoA kinase
MLIGITGTDGAGKGSVVSYLVNKFGFVHYSSRDLIMLEAEKRGLEPNRANARIVGNAMRAEYGPDVIVKEALKKMSLHKVDNAIIESIRAISEVETLKKAGGVLLAVDAPAKVRYQRIVGRGSVTDKVSFEDFVKHETLEMNDPDPNGMQKAKVMEMADYTISNSCTIPELHVAIDEFLKKFSK